MHREAALDSLRNVLAVVGGASILADFTTIKVWLILPMLVLAFLIWYLDYERHFRGQTVDEAKILPYSARPAAAPEAQAH